MDSTCAGGCCPPAAHCCQPSPPAGSVPHGVQGSLWGGQHGEEGKAPAGMDAVGTGDELGGGRGAGGKRPGNRDHDMGAVSSAVSHLGKWGLLNPRATWDKGPKPGLGHCPVQRQEAASSPSQGHLTASSGVNADASSKPQGCLVTPLHGHWVQDSVPGGLHPPLGRGNSSRAALVPTLTHHPWGTHPDLRCFIQPLASGQPPTCPPSLNMSRWWKKHLQQPGVTCWLRANTVHMWSCEHLCVQTDTCDKIHGYTNTLPRSYLIRPRQRPQMPKLANRQMQTLSETPRAHDMCVHTDRHIRTQYLIKHGQCTVPD